MAKTKPTLAFQDTAPFDANLAIFAAYLAGLDADLAEAATPLPVSYTHLRAHET